jgi:hypothetical protein
MQYKGWKGKIVGKEQHYRKGDYHLFVSFSNKRPKAQLFSKGRERALAQKMMPADATMQEVISWAESKLPASNPGKTRKAATVTVTNPLEHVRKGMSEAQQRKIVSRNIAREMDAGKPQRQAVAIALSQRRKDLGLPPRKNPSRKGLVVKQGVSHLDHGLSDGAIKYIQKKYKDCDRFFIESFRLPRKFGMLESALYGPLAGDPAIKEGQVEYVTRGDRKWPSRMIKKPMRKTSMVTVIAGPHEGDACVLYTAYGGPAAPREPGDPSVQKDQALLEESEAFWSKHALAMPQTANPKGKTRYSQPVTSGTTIKDVRERFVAFLPDSFQEIEGTDGKAYYAVAGGRVPAGEIRKYLSSVTKLSDDLEDVYVERGDYIVANKFFSKKYGILKTVGVDFDGKGRFLIAGEVLAGPNEGKTVKFLLEKLVPVPDENAFWHGPPLSRARRVPKTRPAQRSQAEIMAGIYEQSLGMSREEARREAGIPKTRVAPSEPSASRGPRRGSKPPSSVAAQVAAFQERAERRPRSKPRAARPKGKGPGKHEQEAMRLDLDELEYEMDNLSDERLAELVEDMAEKWTVSEELGTLTKDFGKEGRKKWSSALKMGRRKLKNRNLGYVIEYDDEARAKLLSEHGVPFEEIARRMKMSVSDVRKLVQS